MTKMMMQSFAKFVDSDEMSVNTVAIYLSQSQTQ